MIMVRWDNMLTNRVQGIECACICICCEHQSTTHQWALATVGTGATLSLLMPTNKDATQVVWIDGSNLVISTRSSNWKVWEFSCYLQDYSQFAFAMVSCWLARLIVFVQSISKRFASSLSSTRPTFFSEKSCIEITKWIPNRIRVVLFHLLDRN